MRDASIESTPPVELHKPPISYSQRVVKDRDEHKYGKFFEISKKFHINITFFEAITDIPSYGKFLKDLPYNKGKWVKNAMVSLIEECSAIIQNRLLLKLFIQVTFPSHGLLGMLLLIEHFETLGLV